MPNKKITIITRNISDAHGYLATEQCVAIPTESVYGLAADARSDKAVQAIYSAKGRPLFNPLIIHVCDLEMAREWGVFNDWAEKLAAAFWTTTNLDTPVTLVVKQSNPALSHLVTAGLDTVAIRFTAHPIANALIKALGFPLAAPSANRSNYISPTTAQAVYDDLNGSIPCILDGGPCLIGLESTIIDTTGDTPAILRLGGTASERVMQVLGVSTIAQPTEAAAPIIKAPGMLKKHYAPRIPVRLNASTPIDGEAYLAFGACDYATLNLSPSACVSEAAANLFHMMRVLDAEMYTGIAIAPIPNVGLGRAINDRLRRAAASSMP